MKKNCPENLEAIIAESFSEEKELPLAIQQHIAECESCKKTESEMAMLTGKENLEIPDPGEAYFESIWDELEDKIDKKVQKKKDFYRQLIQMAAVALLFLSIGLWLGKSPGKPTEPKNIIAANNNDDYKAFTNRSRVLLTSVMNMDEYQATELLTFSIDLSEKLINELSRLKVKYEDQPELLETLKRIERVLIVLSSLKSGSIKDLKVLQYGIRSDEIIESI